ncbi:MAG: major facilitator family transporter [Novosphingobium lindaniclasticum]|jgi:MFS family permease|uniref:MFS transporter n=1 Tax=Novosphingobium lindaniclasticum TaxID=1329895 RepID=UPI00240A9154|nr:MFS transporter [Novosphingobium lindaniclasticum]MDF2640328.1 major facilitator family transporter [Novosphingobium lindaniclasticum]
MVDIGEPTVRRITWRLMPLLCLLYLVAYIDRQNVAFAKLQMVGDLGLSEAAYGLGSALFFLGYCLFEIPSNLVLERVGPRLWFARIIGAWGLVTLALGFAWTPTSFYILRFLLGVAEAGFFPGVLYLLTLWFPQKERAQAIGQFMIASALANAVGAAIGGLLLELDGVAGLRGWQWVFVATAVPALLLVPVVLTRLPRSPAEAPWLTDPQKEWLAATLAEEGTTREHANPLRALGDGRVILLCLAYLGLPLSAYGLSYWLPTIVRGFGVGNATNGLLNVIPWLGVAAALWWLPRRAASSDGFKRFIVGPALVGVVTLILAAALPSPALQFAALCIAAAAIFAGQPFFWVLPGRFLTGGAAAAGFAAINSVGNLGGFVAQSVVPKIHDATGSDLAPMFFLATMLGLSGGAIVLIERRIPR